MRRECRRRRGRAGGRAGGQAGRPAGGRAGGQAGGRAGGLAGAHSLGLAQRVDGCLGRRLVQPLARQPPAALRRAHSAHTACARAVPSPLAAPQHTCARGGSLGRCATQRIARRPALSVGDTPPSLTKVPVATSGTPRASAARCMKSSGRRSSTLSCTWWQHSGTPASSTCARKAGGATQQRRRRDQGVHCCEGTASGRWPSKRRGSSLAASSVNQVYALPPAQSPRAVLLRRGACKTWWAGAESSAELLHTRGDCTSPRACEARRGWRRPRPAPAPRPPPPRPATARRP